MANTTAGQMPWNGSGRRRRPHGRAVSRGMVMERARLTLYLLDRFWRLVSARAPGAPLTLAQVVVPVPERLLIAPQDLRTGDPTRATEIYSGRFAFAGKVALLDGKTPFELDPPSREWAEVLHGFSWLRHLRAAGTTIARANGRALVGDWMRNPGRARAVAADPEVTARRVIAWLTQAPFILQDADHDFYRRFMRSIARQVRGLRKAANDAPDGYPRLLVVIALVFAGLCMSEQSRLLRAAQKRLSEELERQILPDGGSITRSPGVLIDLLLDLLPLRHAFAARNQPAPPALMNAIDRMMPMLRFFRHGDGAFALFHGMGHTAADQLATILAYDDARGAPVANAPHSGFQRLDAKGTVVIADTGPPPPLAASAEAHASCLAFEFSSGRNRIIVNCGMTSTNREMWRQVARATAAHSTAVVGDTSSCRFLHGAHLTRLAGVPIISGPRDVPVQRGGREGAVLLRASHDGYAEPFGILHQRSWRLAADGSRLDGEDMFRPAEGAPSVMPQVPFAVRFHLHPQVQVDRLDDPSTVLLGLPNGEAWAFVAPGQQVVLEESVFLAAPDGPHRTTQLVLLGALDELPRIVWTLLRTREAQVPRGGGSRGSRG
ncbi:heparinase II/III family protein [Azorhizobium doebereinerae]|uniref:heparinase II/III family protein n=1 Tax=Azorhizobium doebereinerae TaxID=281091 RepID=UPI001FD9A896|nr:heparinase II/III family protein [Azorhizobium doebereinerae]